MGKIIIFARPSTPQVAGQEFGHVGWGYEVSPGKYRIGSVENAKGKNPVNPAEMDFWAKSATDPCVEFGKGPLGRFAFYDLYKEMHVSRPNVDAALAMEKWVSQQAYDLFGRNCMNSTYDILRAYGATFLPDIHRTPAHWLPIVWFKAVQAQPMALFHAKAPVHICLYEHPGLEGARYEISGSGNFSHPDLHRQGWGDVISSIVVRSGSIKLYEHQNFQGSYLEYKGPTLVDPMNGWNDKISSLVAVP